MKAEISSADDFIAAREESLNSGDAFWLRIAHTFDWMKRPTVGLTGSFHQPETPITWFEDGDTNLCYNCIDRHLPFLDNKPAFIFEPNKPEDPSRIITFRQLFHLVQHFANALCSLGVFEGDRVGIYMPMIPEAAIAMLACARIGAVHSVIFGGFSAQSLSDRLNDAGCKVLITADSFFRAEKEIPLKQIADEALKTSPGIESVVVYKHSAKEVNIQEGRDIWWDEVVNRNLPYHFPAQMKSESPLFILYTSGSTGKPKGILHTTGGYMVYAGYTFRNVFQPKEDDVFWCSADVGWITGHTYLLYGALLNGNTTVIFEGVPSYPDHGRFWEVIDKHKVNIFYTAPTALRSLMTHGHQPLEGKDLSSLRILGSVGEPINHEAWEWFHHEIGKNRCPLADTWWQTETGGIMITSPAGVVESVPTFAGFPMPGIEAVLLTPEGKELEGDNEGILCIKRPWPGMARTTFGDHNRFVQTYLAPFKGYYFTGDGAKRDEKGYFRITGRIDDVINVSGHRIGTAEIEDTLDEHPDVIETAVVGFPHDVKGEALYAYVVLGDEVSHAEADIVKELQKLVADTIGAFARPDKIQIVPALPKTRSGKIMRRILRKIAAGELENLGDVSTLTDPSVPEVIIKGRK